MPELFEDMAQEVRSDAHAGAADGDFDMGMERLQRDVHSSISGREFECIRQQAPDRLFDALRVDDDG